MYRRCGSIPADANDIRTVHEEFTRIFIPS